ncbi:hypothetical protein BGW38_000970 [Lunasporangiospora selenospora]|uniref:SET domain-containing protein n=1 Tax=Lunasporangiospora selenospora TaxID=979761 RepID=A0A9P6FUD1_9FUNG|nr:hypothetical protein BGW38_000970 [Lunasporangiospora selenospora]
MESESYDIFPEFSDWARMHGITFDHVYPKETKGMGIGLFARSKPANTNKTNIQKLQEQTQGLKLDQEAKSKPNKELLFVPQSLILSKTRVSQLNAPVFHHTLDQIGEHNLSERLTLVLFLLYERLCVAGHFCYLQRPDDIPPPVKLAATSCNGSVFSPYVATLPEVCTPVTLDPDLVKGYLAGTLLLDSVCAKRSKLEAEFEQLSGNLGVFDNWPTRPKVEDFIWADATFWSRVLSFQSQFEEDPQDCKRASKQPADDMHMVPVLDFANHAAKPNIRWEVEPDGIRVWANQELDVNQSQDQEVFLSYGEKPNSELLFLHGFILHDNPMQTLTMALPMDETDPLYMPKAHMLMRLNIPPRISLYLSEDKPTNPPNLVRLYRNLWVNPEAQYLLWIYSLNEDDGVGVHLEDPEFMVCLPGKPQDEGNEDMEEMDLMEDQTLGRLMLMINKTVIESTEQLEVIVPKLEIFPVLILRSLVLIASQIEYHITRIMATGDRVQKVEGVEIVRAIQYDMESLLNQGSDSSTPFQSGTSPVSRLGLATNIKITDCHLPTILEPDRDHPITPQQVELEAYVSRLVTTMKEYRTLEMDLLVKLGDEIGEAQTQCLQENTFIQTYLAMMQNNAEDE